MKSDVGAVIGVMTDSSLIVEEALESEGGMNMCTALEKLEEKGPRGGKDRRKAGRKTRNDPCFSESRRGHLDDQKASGWSEEEIEAIRRKME